MHCNKQECPELQEHRHVEGEVEDTVLFHQVFSVEDIALTQFGAEFASEFIERSVPLIASRLDLDRADFCRRSTVIFRASPS
ncbi:hypothetical protein FYZ44_01980 [Mobiluncus mulieris]|nr:hypothetical protein [Mobiluncus mulieris]NMW80925.1 hypothetical protein [Mobiluncus mulieris]